MKRICSTVVVRWVLFLIRSLADAQNHNYHGLETKLGVNYTMGPTSFEHASVKDCKNVVIRGFLKKQCLVDEKVFFKCSFSDNYYRVIEEQCSDQRFSHVCENDPSFYQSCGHIVCPPSFQKTISGVGVCGEIVCSLENKGKDFWHSINIDGAGLSDIRNIFTSERFGSKRCNGVNDCINKINNTVVDERGCDGNITYFHCSRNGSGPWSEVFGSVRKDQVCNTICECENCFDEAHCFNHTVGYMCFHTIRSRSHVMEYLPPKFVCDNIWHCKGGLDERNCRTGETCTSLTFNLVLKNRSRGLNQRNKCAVPDNKVLSRKLCIDYKDQMNCSSNSNISPLLCTVNGYPTTLSQYVICKKPSLCDDALDDECVSVDSSCVIHKHRLCDLENDCPGNADEGDYFCHDLVASCVRKMSQGKENISFPGGWVLDGVEDCVNGIDEDPSQWSKKCGTGERNYFVFGGNPSCDKSTLLKCPGTDNHLIMSEVCKDFSNCDSSLCVASRRIYKTNGLEQLAYKSNRNIFFCLPGLEYLKRVIGVCEPVDLIMTSHIIIGIHETYKIISSRNYAATLNCRDIFGGLYIYLMCSGQCKYSKICISRDVTHTSCHNYPLKERVLALTYSGSLTVLQRNTDGTVHQNFFACANDHCIEFYKVCDLVDDCGDASDEESCTNNFKCKSGEYIPLSRKCNGKFDCLDLTDECNTQCNNQVKIFSHIYMYIAAWTTGTISIALNGCVIVKAVKEFKTLKTGIGRMNYFLVLVISIGDLLQGSFLLLVALADKLFNTSTCFTQFRWTTSKTCNSLGTISTTGSLVSLFSMTILSIIRAKGTRTMKKPSQEMSRKSKVVLAWEIIAIFVLAIILATVPLFPIADEYFVRSLAYENNLLVGDLDKTQHQEIIRAYYGRLSKIEPTWHILKRLLNDMFINNKVESKQIGFYGSNGFCLFNYFLRKDNPQKWFTGSVLLLVFTCVLIIAVSYTIVNVSARRSVSIAGAANKAIVNRNKKIQQKIAVLIATDVLTWIPLIVIALIHFLEVVDASSWHSVFSIIVLPCNSIINPMLILVEKFDAGIKSIWKKVKDKLLRGRSVENVDLPTI